MLVLFVSGEGGHFEQYQRFYYKIKDSLVDTKTILVTDNEPKKNQNIEVVNVGSIRSKKGMKIIDVWRYFKNMIMLFNQIKKYNHITMISTGPGISIGCAFLVKILKGRVIHIETWSRFYSKSMTGRAMYILSDVFYIQNESLKELYSNGIYSGRL